MAIDTPNSEQRVALVTGGSRGLGRALVDALSRSGWRVLTDARDGHALAEARSRLPSAGAVDAVTGDVSDARHREALGAAVDRAGRLDLLVNNASVLGPSPMPRLADYDPGTLASVFAVNAVAPLALAQRVLSHLRTSRGVVVNVTSDAASEAYEGWGGYGASKAALDQLSAVLAVEEPELRVYAFDPGDMRTEMHQAAFPGEDISDRPLPEAVVPPLLRLIESASPSGRYRVSELQGAPA